MNIRTLLGNEFPYAVDNTNNIIIRDWCIQTFGEPGINWVTQWNGNVRFKTEEHALWCIIRFSDFN